MGIDPERVLEALESIRKNLGKQINAEWVVSSIIFYLHSAWFICNKLDRPLNILDIGCSYGYGIYLMLGICRDKVSKIIGVDISDSHILYAREQIKHDNVIFDVGNLTDREYAKTLLNKYGHFDAITCFEVFEHISPRESKKLLENIWLLLNPGGLLFISTPNKKVYDIDAYTEDHVNEVNFTRFLEILRDNNFEIISVEGSRRVSPSLVRLIYKFNLEARRGDIKNELNIPRKYLRSVLVALFEPKRLLFAIFKKTNYRKFLLSIITDRMLNDDPMNSSLVYVIAKKKENTPATL